MLLKALSAGQTPNYHSLSEVWVYESESSDTPSQLPAQFRFIAEPKKWT